MGKVVVLLFLLSWLININIAIAAKMETGTKETHYTVTDHLLFSSAKDPLNTNNPAINLLMHEDYILGERDPYSVSLVFTNRLAPDSSAEETRPFVLEKKTAKADWENFELNLGDTYQEMGRGIALSLYRDDVFGINTTLEGMAFKYRPKGKKLFIMGGRLNAMRSPVVVDPLENPLEERNVWLAGASAEFETGKEAKIGGHYVLTLNEPDDKTGMGNGVFDRTWNTGGLSYSEKGIFEDIDFYGESNVLVRQRLNRGKYDFPPVGVGSYASLVWSPVPWVVKWEFKDYRDFDYEFRRPPSLEVDIVETENESDITATRLYVERISIMAGTRYYGSYLLGVDRLEKATVHHGIFGAKFKGIAKTEWGFRVGFRTVPQKKNLLHGSAKLKIPTFKKQFIEVSLSKQRLNKNLDVFPTVEDRNVIDATYTFSKSWTAGMGYEFIPSNTDITGKHFANLNVSTRSGALTAKAFLGQTSGGTLCSGGVCRQRPAYTGAMFETTYTF